MLWDWNNLSNWYRMCLARLIVALGIGGMWGVFEALSKQNSSQAHATLNPSMTGTLGSQLNASAAAAGAAGSATASNQAARQSGKLMLNNILNHVTRRGPFLGNSAGVLAMTYNLINAYLSSFSKLTIVVLKHGRQLKNLHLLLSPDFWLALCSEVREVLKR
jgi:hypothetical protein